MEFDKFFSLMFDGGTGYLDVVIENKKNRREKVGPLESSKSDLEEPDDEEEEPEQGIEINVSLPHKKSKNLTRFLEAKGHLPLLPFFLLCLK